MRSSVWFLGISTVLVAVLFFACSSENGDKISGIEIGNPSLAITADFSVDYENADFVLAKKEESFLVDSFALALSAAQAYFSYYKNFEATVPGPEVEGEKRNETLFAAEDSSSLRYISFIESGSFGDDFKTLDVSDSYLKSVSVSFAFAEQTPAMQGRILVSSELGNHYVPFEYKLNYFEQLKLSYHVAQLTSISAEKESVPVTLFVRRLIDGLDFSQVQIGTDGVIRFNEAENTALWDSLNARLPGSFMPLSYSVQTFAGESFEIYTPDVWEHFSGSMRENVLTNGDFSSGADGWILASAQATDSVYASKENVNSFILNADVTSNEKVESVRLLHEDIPLVQGKQYQCVFTIWANQAKTVPVQIRSFENGEVILNDTLNVSTDGRSVELNFKVESNTPFGIFELDLGNETNRYHLKNISIFRIN